MDWSAQQAKYGALIQPTPQAPQVVAQPKGRGGLTGFLTGAAKGIAHPFGYLLDAAIGDPVRELTAQLTHNGVAYKNALNRTNKQLGLGDSGTDIGNALKRWGGNSAQALLATAAPTTFKGNIGLGAGYGASSTLAQDNSSLDDVLGGAVTGGVTGGVIHGGSKVLSSILGKAEGAVTKGTEKVAAKQAEKATAQKVLDQVEEEAPYSSINTTGRQKTNMRSTLGFFKDKLNMPVDPASLKAASELATGENGAVSGTFRQILGDAGNVPTSDVLSRAKQALVGESGVLGDVETKGSHANGVLRGIRDTLQGTAYAGEGNLSKTGAADANAVFDALQKTEQRIQSLSSSSGEAAQAEARALKEVKSALQDSIYKNGGVDKAVAAYKLAPEDIASIHKTAAESGVSAETAQHIIDGINNASSGQELRSLQKPFVDASKLSQASDRAGEGVLTKPLKAGEAEKPGFFTGRGGRYNAMEAASLLGGNPLMALPLAANIAAATADDAAPGAFLKAGQKVMRGAEKVDNLVPNGTPNLLKRLTTQVASTQTPSSPQPQPVQSVTPTPSIDNTALTDSSGDPAQTIFTKQNIEKLIIEDLATNQGKNVATLKTLYDTFGKDAEQSTAQKKAAGAAQQAEDTLAQIEDSFKSAGGGQGRIGGVLGNLEGKVGSNDAVKAYNDTATSLAASLYKALGNTGTISDQDQKRITALIPKTTDTAGEAQIKLDQLKNLLQQAKANI